LIPTHLRRLWLCAGFMVYNCWFQRLQRDIREDTGPQVIEMEELSIFTLQNFGKNDVPRIIKHLSSQFESRPDSSYAVPPTEKSDVMVTHLTSTFSPNTDPQPQGSAAYVHESHKHFTHSPSSSSQFYQFVVTVEIIEHVNQRRMDLTV
jgi:hypothetical protein